jgi:hypothetical protein
MSDGLTELITVLVVLVTAITSWLKIDSANRKEAMTDLKISLDMLHTKFNKLPCNIRGECNSPEYLQISNLPNISGHCVIPKEQTLLNIGGMDNDTKKG